MSLLELLRAELTDDGIFVFNEHRRKLLKSGTCLLANPPRLYVIETGFSQTTPLETRGRKRLDSVIITLYL